MDGTYASTSFGGARLGLAARTNYPPMFERFIYYILAPDLFARIVLETGLNLYPPSLTQPKQWVFFLLVLVDYAFQSLTLGRQRFRINISNAVFLLILTMALHGVIVGLCWGNKLPKIFTDTVPVLVTAINVALLNREDVGRGFNFERLVKVVWVYSTVMIFVGLVAMVLHRNAVPTLGGAESTPICLTIILVYLNRKPRLTVLDLLWVCFIIGPSVPNANRTTLLVFSLAFLIFVLPHIFRDAKQLYFSVFLAGAAAGAFVLLVPSDSLLMQRINGSVESATSGKNETSGSLYERKAEWEAIKSKLAHLGPAGEYFGYGAGGIYKVQFSGGIIPENYSHAHFSWSLFRLRYGYIGFVYLAIYSGFLLFSFLSHLVRSDPLSRIVSVLSLWCIVFLFTYVFFNFLAAGLQFADTDDDRS